MKGPMKVSFPFRRAWPAIQWPGAAFCLGGLLILAPGCQRGATEKPAAKDSTAARAPATEAPAAKPVSPPVAQAEKAPTPKEEPMPSPTPPKPVAEKPPEPAPP